MDYPCAEFGNFNFTAVLVLSCGQQTDRITHTLAHTNTWMTSVGVSNKVRSNCTYNHGLVSCH